MRSLIKYTGLICLTFFSLSVKGQKSTDTQNLEYQKYNNLYLANVSGDVKVEGYEGDKIILDVKRMLDGRGEIGIEELKTSVKLAEIVRGDSLIIYIKGLGNCFCADEDSNNWNSQYRYNLNDWDFDFDYNFDFTVKVPKDVNLNLSTINNGDVEVDNSSGSLNIRNVNGGIFLTNVSGKIKARTINGDVLIDYSNNPSDNSKFYSLNGDIKANFKKDLSAVMSFKSFNGDLFTNIDDIEYLPMKVKKSELEYGEGVSYKIGGRTEIKIRNGGLYLDFETFNGDVIIKEI